MSNNIDLGDGIEVEGRLKACPVEYSGTVDGKAFYFRARRLGWIFTIADTEDDAVGETQAEHVVHGKYGLGDDRFAASWMPHETAQAIIKSCIGTWRLVRRAEEETQEATE